MSDRTVTLLHRASLALLVLSALLVVTGCSVNWVTEVSGMLPVLGSAASAFLALLAAFGKKVPPDTLAKVTSWQSQLNTDLGTLSGLIEDWNAASDDGKATVIAQIESLSSQIVTNFNTILPELHVDDPATQAKVTAVAQAILVQMTSIAAIIPAVKGASQITQVANAGKLPLSAHQFTTSFNQVLAHGTGDAETDKAISTVAPLPVPQRKTA